MIERFGDNANPEMPPTPPEEESSREQQWQELLRQGKGWEAIQYYLERDWLRDEDIWDALDAVEEAETRALLEGNLSECKRLQAEYEQIRVWRLGEEVVEEEVFRRYQEDLNLTPEDFEKKILDVGSGSAKFAKWAKGQGISSQIYSLDPAAELRERSKSVFGKAEQLPFRDESFDLVIARGGAPLTFLGIEDAEAQQEAMRLSLSEMLRVAKRGGEVRFGLVFGEGVNERQRRFRSSLSQVLNELRTKPYIAIQEIPKEEFVYRRDAEGNVTLSDRFYLVRIQKTY